MLRTMPLNFLNCRAGNGIILHFFKITIFSCPSSHCVTRPKFWPIPRPRLFIRDKFCQYQYRDFFPRPITRLFFGDQIFRDQYRDFFSETKYSETDTETYFPRPNLSILIPRLFFRDQIFWYWYRDFFSETKFFDTDNKTFLTRPNFPIPIPRLLKN